MPKNIKRILMVCSILLLLLSMSLGLAGCASESGSSASAQEITDKAVSNSAAITTLKYQMSMDMDMEITGGSDPGKVTMSGDSVCSLDLTDKEMQMSIEGKWSFPGSDGDTDFEEELYVTGGWMYMRMSMPGVGDNWIKEKLPDYSELPQDQLNQAVELLKTALKVTNVGSEKVNGVDCNIIVATPDMAALFKWVQSQQGDTGLDVEKIDLGKMFKSFSIKEWISKDKYLPMKADIRVSMEIEPADMGETSESANMDKTTMTMSAQTKYYDYGKPVTIQLPPEAQDAGEVPYAE